MWAVVFVVLLLVPATAESQGNSERTLKSIAAQIDREIGKPLQGFRVIPDSRNVDVDGDTYSATYRAEASRVVNLDELRRTLLARARGWESGDVSQDDDSLDITFEKAYPAVVVDGERRVPMASVTLSATTYQEERKTALNYDVDITLEEGGGDRRQPTAKGRDRDDKDRDRAERTSNRPNRDRGGPPTGQPRGDKGDKDESGLGEDAREAIEEAVAALDEKRDELREDGERLDPRVEQQVKELISRARRALATGAYDEAIRLAAAAEALIDETD